MSIKIYGASDDLIEVEGAVTDEFDCYGKTTLLVAGPEYGALEVSAEYGPRGWSLWVSAHGDMGDFPDWPVRFTDRPDYEGDPAVIIDAPAGATVTQKENK